MGGWIHIQKFGEVLVLCLIIFPIIGVVLSQIWELKHRQPKFNQLQVNKVPLKAQERLMKMLTAASKVSVNSNEKYVFPTIYIGKQYILIANKVDDRKYSIKITETKVSLFGSEIKYCVLRDIEGEIIELNGKTFVYSFLEGDTGHANATNISVKETY